MSDQADIFGHPVTDAEKARESFAAFGIYAGEPSATSDERGDDILKGRRPWSSPPLVVSERVPLGEIWLVNSKTGETTKLINLRRECDFKFGDCQLGHGHALPHCVPDPDGSGSYLMVDESGLILREI
jgi:hypothetical protein